MSNDELRDSLMKGLRQFATRPVDDAIAKRLLECVTCIEADPKDPASFDAMREQLEKLEADRATGGNRLFYLATPPNAFAPIARELGRTGMLKEDGAVAAAGGRKAVRHRPRLGQGAERRTAEDRRRAPDLPDRSLSRQGNGAEHPGAALCQRHVRADLESQPHRSHPDHRRRKARRRPSRQLLRRDRRAARHGAEPSVSAAVAGRDGAAGAIRRAFGALGKGRSAGGDPDPERGRGAAEFGARPISRPARSATPRSRIIARPRTSSRTAPPRPMPR